MPFTDTERDRRHPLATFLTYAIKFVEDMDVDGAVSSKSDSQAARSTVAPFRTVPMLAGALRNPGKIVVRSGGNLRPQVTPGSAPWRNFVDALKNAPACCTGSAAPR